jgi:ADP-heptose:LPS heptosyltransferase
MKYQLQNNRINKIAIFRALQIGDLLCTIPAIRSIRSAFPEAKIDLIGLPWSKSFTQRFNQYFDGFIEFGGYPGLPEIPFEISKTMNFLQDIQRRQYDLVIQLQGEGNIANPLVSLFGAKLSAGFKGPNEFSPSQDLFVEYPSFGHEIHRMLTVTKFLGLPYCGDYLEFPISTQEKQATDQLLSEHYLAPKKYVVIHAGARDPRRRWEAENFGKTIDFIVEKGYQVVLTGTPDEKEIVEAVQNSATYPVVNLCGKTSLGVTASLIQNAALLVSNDTGVSHIAAALQAPSVIISQICNPIQWSPLNRSLHKVVLWEKTPSIGKVFDEIQHTLQEYTISKKAVHPVINFPTSTSSYRYTNE